ncbi:MAG TPA: hypothetical protein VFJ30_17655 [Phycisphaerae bacterium]|nr:hypothetical protein [Phycisphaerae bacterium]
MKDTRSIAIAVLAVSATILATVLVLSFMAAPAPAESAIGAGDYIMITGQYTTSTDLLYVFDLQKKGLNVYAYDRNGNRLQPIKSIELQKLFRGE